MKTYLPGGDNKLINALEVRKGSFAISVIVAPLGYLIFSMKRKTRAKTQFILITVMCPKYSNKDEWPFSPGLPFTTEGSFNGMRYEEGDLAFYQEKNN